MTDLVDDIGVVPVAIVDAPIKPAISYKVLSEDFGHLLFVSTD